MADNREAGTVPGAARRAMLQGAGLGGALALLGSGVARAADAGPFPSHPKWRLVFVNHVTTNPFFVPTQYGIKDACDLLGCTSQWTGSANADVAEMVNAMNAAIAGKADAIAVPIVDPRAFNDPTAKALAAGIPVFSYNADAPPGSGNKRLAYIGQDLYQSGYSMGERIASHGRFRAGRDFHRHARPAQHPAAPGRRDRRDQEIRQEDRRAVDRHRRDGKRGTVAHPLLLSRPPGPEGHVRRRCRQHAGRRRGDAAVQPAEPRACMPAATTCCRRPWS